MLDHAWERFRTYACDPGVEDSTSINLGQGVAAGWAHNDTSPCAVNPLGTTKVVPAGQPGAGTSHRIDGAIINDIRRGDVYQWPPVFTQYPWVGLDGFVPAALILTRAGYPAFAAADEAPLRALDYLWFLREQTGDTLWFTGNVAKPIIHLINAHYVEQYLINGAVSRGRTVGYTRWTHPGS